MYCSLIRFKAPFCACSRMKQDMSRKQAQPSGHSQAQSSLNSDGLLKSATRLTDRALKSESVVTCLQLALTYLHKSRSTTDTETRLRRALRLLRSLNGSFVSLLPQTSIALVLSHRLRMKTVPKLDAVVHAAIPSLATTNSARFHNGHCPWMDTSGGF